MSCKIFSAIQVPLLDLKIFHWVARKSKERNKKHWRNNKFWGCVDAWVVNVTKIPTSLAICSTFNVHSKFSLANSWRCISYTSSVSPCFVYHPARSCKMFQLLVRHFNVLSSLVRSFNNCRHNLRNLAWYLIYWQHPYFTLYIIFQVFYFCNVQHITNYKSSVYMMNNQACNF